MINKLKSAFLLLASGKSDLFFYKLRKKLGFKNILSPLPLWLIIEPANFCNLKCPLCPTGSGRINRSPRLMTFEEFKKIIDQARGYVIKLVFFNLGEPFLNKDAVKMIRYAVSAGMHIKTSTNAQLFESEDLCLKIVQSGLQHLIISLDGADQETLIKYRAGADFNKTIKAIKNINAAKEKLDLETPKIELQFLVMRHNEHQREKMAQLAKELGVDMFLEKTICLYEVPDFQEVAKKFLPSNNKFSRYETNGGEYKLKGTIPNSCNQVSSVMVINSDGSVVPCCYDNFCQHVMGNAFKESLRDIWRGDKYRVFREHIKKDRKSIPICNICPEGRVEFLCEKSKLK